MFKKREKETMCQVELGIEKKQTQAALLMQLAFPGLAGYP